MTPSQRVLFSYVMYYADKKYKVAIFRHPVLKINNMKPSK